MQRTQRTSKEEGADRELRARQAPHPARPARGGAVPGVHGGHGGHAAEDLRGAGHRLVGAGERPHRAESPARAVVVLVHAHSTRRGRREEAVRDHRVSWRQWQWQWFCFFFRKINQIAPAYCHHPPHICLVVSFDFSYVLFF